MGASSRPMPAIDLPPEVEAVFREFRTCEFSTLARDGTPITWPTLPFYDATQGRFVVTTSIGLPQKALNVRREPKVALLYSEPTASGLVAPPAVLVQGDAVAPDEVVTSVAGFEEQFEEVFRRQPASTMYSANPLTRAFFDWYYMRLMMEVTPRRIRWWPNADFAAPPREVELPRVA